ncbi:hypothetical protein KKD80_02570 [Patescibacteria group bacterium]|nr:hypothetical protein [Patescibacteria group bacterium]
MAKREDWSFEDRGTEGTLGTPGGEVAVHSKAEAFSQLEGARQSHIPNVYTPPPSQEGDVEGWKEASEKIWNSDLPDK